MRILPWAALAAIGVLLSACATAPSVPADPTAADWALEGRLAVRSDRGNYAASMRWEQRGDLYTISLVGPLGQGATLVRGDFHHIVIRRAGHPPVSSHDVQGLMQQQLGWSVPIRHVVSWVRGQPSAAGPVEIEAISDGRPEVFRQAGFTVSVTREGELPSRIEARHGDFRLVVRVRSWG